MWAGLALGWLLLGVGQGPGLAAEPAVPLPEDSGLPAEPSPLMERPRVPPLEQPAPREGEPPAPVPEADSEGRALWVSVAGGVGGMLMNAALMGAAPVVASLALGGTALWRGLQGDQQLCMLACCCGVPVQALVLSGTMLMGPCVASPVAWAAARFGARQRTALGPAWVTAQILNVLAMGGVAVVDVLANVVNLGICCCTYGWFSTLLTGTYEWKPDVAEYYVMRRILPPVWLGGLCMTQVCSFGALLASQSALGAMMGWLMSVQGRPESEVGRARFPDIWTVDDEPPEEEAPLLEDEEIFGED